MKQLSAALSLWRKDFGAQTETCFLCRVSVVLPCSDYEKWLVMRDPVELKCIFTFQRYEHWLIIRRVRWNQFWLQLWLRSNKTLLVENMMQVAQPCGRRQYYKNNPEKKKRESVLSQIRTTDLNVSLLSLQGSCSIECSRFNLSSLKTVECRQMNVSLPLWWVSLYLQMH